MGKVRKTPLNKFFSKISSRLLTKPETASPEEPAKIPSTLRLIFFIIDWSNTKILSDVFEEENVRFHFICKARGTASSDILDLLGIGASDKGVVICLEQAVMGPLLIREVRKKLGSKTPGAGIAFMIPLSGISTPVLRVFKESIAKNEKFAAETNAASAGVPVNKGRRATDREGGQRMGDIKNDLIISIINQGYSDEFMTVAREAGATGGTIINARGLAHEGPVKFFGVSVQDEKEIILMLIGRDKTLPIMQAISQSYGITTKAAGLIFSLPADMVMGLNFE
ncbi:MAG: hypothetical protein LBL43_02835 [Treponema sp.]|jgi:hypothetical protein|nr:hypothetical protein [Treponema sp.]